MRRLTTRFMALGTATLVALGTLALPMRTQASVTTAPGVTKNQILIGTSLPLSGLAAAYGIIAGGEKAYFDYVNAHGGIYGRKLKLVALDDGYDPAKTLNNVKNLVLSRNVFALLGILGTDNNIAIEPFVTSHQVPLIFPLTGSSKLISPLSKYIFDYLPSYTLEARVLTDYAVNTLHAKKLAVFYQNDDFGKEGLAATTAEALKDGAHVFTSAEYDLTDLDMTTQVQNIQQANPDAVIMFAVPPSALIFLATATKAGFHPQVLSSSIAADPAIIKALGPTAEGMYFDAWLPDPNGHDPHVLTFRGILAKYGNATTAPPVPETEAGMAAAQILVEGLRHAGRNPTRDSLIKALESLRHWNGGLAPNVTYSATRHDGPEGAYMAQVRNGVLTPIGAYSYPQ